MQLRGPYAGVSAELNISTSGGEFGTNGRRGGRLHRTDSVQHRKRAREKRIGFVICASLRRPGGERATPASLTRDAVGAVRVELSPNFGDGGVSARSAMLGNRKRG